MNSHTIGRFSTLASVALGLSCSSQSSGSGSGAGSTGGISAASSGGSSPLGGTPGASGGVGGTSSNGGSSAGGAGGNVGTGNGGAIATGGSTGAGAGNGSGGMAGGTGGAAATGGLSGAGGSVDGGNGTSANLAPPKGALLGLYYGDKSIAATTTELGRQVPIHLVYYAWDDDWTKGDTESDLSANRIPLVNWEPDGIDFNDIVSGSLDSTIRARASESQALGRQFFLDFAAEMNGDEAWSGNDPTLYVAAYKHIHDLFVAAGATNVVWAWCPNVTDTDGGNKTTMDYYPGDTYVDWTGVDGYNWGSTGQGDGWQSFQAVFSRIYPLLAAKGKPILIGEMASTELGGDKGAWISAIVPTLKTDFPMIKGLAWFDVNKETDWRISSSPGSQQAFIQMANDPYFNP